MYERILFLSFEIESVSKIRDALHGFSWFDVLCICLCVCCCFLLFVCLFFFCLTLGAVFCPSKSFSGITWSMTAPGMSDLQRCPNATGKVTVQYKKLLNFNVMRCLDLYLS